ncbi:recombinase family protein [Dietzia psychralcaliphila]|uniref:recombinase family protein n=1 Tax=Dietzia psychralcaliphila TaxID=139021 RepID=UPI000D2F8959|nr:recombinase family protein [Dietzia psychralcaliphila]PTM85350.1 DNA invertase Pin-like site-specific DNA recombinase [Dietzia psychralcaliphila]
MRIGYGRIYPTDPDPEEQHEALTESDCQRILVDDARETGAAQPKLATALDDLDAGDTLVVSSLDRLARNPAVLVDHVTAIDERGAYLHILNRQIHTGQDPERIFLRTIEALGDVNTIGRSQRIRAGIAKAATNGRRPGRPMIKAPKLEKVLRKLLSEKDEHGHRRHTITEIAREARVSRATVYRYIDLFKEHGVPVLED